MRDFSIEWQPGTSEEVRILKLTGPFVLQGVFDFQTMVRSETASGVAVDLTEVPYMDSAALGSLLGLHVSCQRDHRQYGLIGVSDRLRTLFRVAGVDGMLRVYSSLADFAAAGSKAASA
jgi:anti-anti-sigma factor